MQHFTASFAGYTANTNENLLMFHVLDKAEEEWGNQQNRYFSEGEYDEENKEIQREDVGDSVARVAEDELKGRKQELADSMEWELYRVTQLIDDINTAARQKYDTLAEMAAH